MKSGLWYLFLLSFQVEILKGEVNDSAKSEMFTIYNGGVQILCRYPTTIWQFKMQLLRGNQVLCELTKTEGSGKPGPPKNITFCISQLSNSSVSFFLHNLDSSYASYYLCRLLIFDPPPFQIKTLSKEYLHIYESQLCCQLKFWLPIGCTGFILIYIFACVFVCWLTKKKRRSSVHDPNSEYMFMAAMPTAKKPGGTACLEQPSRLQWTSRSPETPLSQGQPGVPTPKARSLRGDPVDLPAFISSGSVRTQIYQGSSA